ncbi:DNA-invertase hin [compost metagenome]
MKRVAAYIRVSTDEQVDKGNSLTEQTERLKAYCFAMGWNEPTLFIDDGYSAKNLKRPAIQRMITSVQENNFDVVLTAKLDRLCRNLLELLQIIKILEDHDCNYVSSSEGFDTTTAAGKMVLQILGAFAEFERERISERVKDNMLSLAKNTDRAISRPCYGYDIADGKYLINENEAINVKYMFDLAEAGHGHRMIAKMLNDRGITTKQKKMWDQVNVKRLMSKETLIGTSVYNMRQSKNGKVVIRDKSEWVVKENNHPAIISTEQFNKVKEIMESRSRANKHADNETYLLTGLLKCAHCGKNMKGNTSRHKTKYGDYTYYRYLCSSYVLGYGCKHHIVHREDIEKLIIEEINNLASASTKELDIKIAASSSTNDLVKEIKELLNKSDKKMQKQIEAYENDLISASDLKKARERIDKEREILNQDLLKAESRTDSNQDKIKEQANLLLDDVNSEDRLRSKNAIRKLVSKIDLADGELVSVTWNPLF